MRQLFRQVSYQDTHQEFELASLHKEDVSQITLKRTITNVRTVSTGRAPLSDVRTVSTGRAPLSDERVTALPASSLCDECIFFFLLDGAPWVSEIATHTTATIFLVIDNSTNMTSTSTLTGPSYSGSLANGARIVTDSVVYEDFRGEGVYLWAFNSLG